MKKSDEEIVKHTQSDTEMQNGSNKIPGVSVCDLKNMSQAWLYMKQYKRGVEESFSKMQIH